MPTKEQFANEYIDVYYADDKFMIGEHYRTGIECYKKFDAASGWYVDIKFSELPEYVRKDIDEDIKQEIIKEMI